MYHYTYNAHRMRHAYLTWHLPDAAPKTSSRPAGTDLDKFL